ncbi:MAG: hypothetical protein NC218_08475 [Acetobacter sp.]|nr:hypothetical protein [Acetobacter sp.]
MTKKGEKQLVRGNDTYDLLIDLILNLSPLQAKNLYSELLPRYTSTGRVKYYNTNLEEDPKGKVRLMPFQYKILRTKFGDTYLKEAFECLTSYIEYLETNVEEADCKAKLKLYSKGTHNKHLIPPDGWVYNKKKGYIVKERPKVAINPFTIEDFETALEYVSSIPKELWNTSMDVKSLLMRFPELNSL